ncbi:hypothetical protein WJX72_003529 [[Myrmecia] bisecta]|uniref:Uncharacterized protein n=1 Tax=[Myrmecia] bisecta TaxID=41462 RepID=A0AAW1PWM0_9CHLO
MIATWPGEKASEQASSAISTHLTVTALFGARKTIGPASDQQRLAAAPVVKQDVQTQTAFPVAMETGITCSS